MDRKLVSKQSHEVSYLLSKWDIKKHELLTLKGKKRSRKVIEKLLKEAGYSLREKADA